MSGRPTGARQKTKQTRFPVSLYFILFVILLLMSALHVGLIVLMGTLGWNAAVQSFVPIIYWAAVALGVTLYTLYRMKQAYDEPMQRLAEATAKVAGGDFSIYIPPIHTADRYDYLDTMFLDFNKMVEELGSMETLKTDFFSNVSHEIKTPISVIQNYAEMLQSDTLPEERRREYAETILAASGRLSELITNLLRLGKLEKQAILPESAAYDVSRQLCECALGFETQWERKSIDFIADVEDLAFVEADESLMEIVWSNLLSNALKFTEEGGTVTLAQTSTADEVIVTVSDTGCGMSEETRSRIFDKFYQGDTSHATEGNGLGLALPARILQLMECSILVDSNPGEGSTFTVIMPACKGDGKNE